MVEQLGLDLIREVTVETATGPTMARIFGGGLLNVDGRSGLTEVLELPAGGEAPLLGVIPLESLGIELDLQNERLRLLPDHGPGTYYTAYGYTLLDYPNPGDRS